MTTCLEMNILRTPANLLASRCYVPERVCLITGWSKLFQDEKVRPRYRSKINGHIKRDILCTCSGWQTVEHFELYRVVNGHWWRMTTSQIGYDAAYVDPNATTSSHFRPTTTSPANTTTGYPGPSWVTSDDGHYVAAVDALSNYCYFRVLAVNKQVTKLWKC